jgi:hypothetical protein
MKSVNFASVLFIAAALLWACQHTVPADKVASILDYGAGKTVAR